MTDTPKYTIQAISDITSPDDIRVVIFINNEFVHVPLMALLKDLRATTDDLETRVTALETP